MLLVFERHDKMTKTNAYDGVLSVTIMEVVSVVDVNDVR